MSNSQSTYPENSDITVCHISQCNTPSLVLYSIGTRKAITDEEVDIKRYVLLKEKFYGDLGGA